MGIQATYLGMPLVLVLFAALVLIAIVMGLNLIARGIAWWRSPSQRA